MAGLAPAIHAFLVTHIAVSVPSSFRGDAKHRTGMCDCTSENLEIPRCAIAHLRSGPSDHPGMTALETWMPGTRPGMTNVERHSGPIVHACLTCFSRPGSISSPFMRAIGAL